MNIDLDHEPNSKIHGAMVAYLFISFSNMQRDWQVLLT